VTENKDEPCPPLLTREEAEKLVAWLNWAGKCWPRIVGTLMLHQIPVELNEIVSDGRLPNSDQCAAPDGVRLPNIQPNGGGRWTMGFCELLSAAIQTRASYCGLNSKVLGNRTEFTL
jgi:hypothetical protein